MNMNIWNLLKQPPDWAMKKIAGGRLNGKTDISPLWRLQVMTETFGMCGIGWKYALEKYWTEEGPAGQKLLFVQVNLFVKSDGQWSDAIPGFGGDFVVEKESAGLHANDEALKMAITDALGNAMKNLGVAAVVYSNGIDGTKYNRPASPVTPPASTITPPKPITPPVAPPAAKQDTPEPVRMATEGQRKSFWAKAEKLGWSKDDLASALIAEFGVKSSAEMTLEQGKTFIEYLDAEKDAQDKIKAVDAAFGATESLPFPPK